MANENINARELKDIASANAQLSGNAREFNDIVRESINSLKMMAKSYDNILSKIDNMNKGAINTKSINKELEKSNVKVAIAKKQIEEAERRASADQINRANVYEAAVKAVEDQKKKLQREINIGDAAKIAQEQVIMEQKFRELDLSKEQLQAEDLNIIALRETSRIAQEINEEIEYRLNKEKELEKSLGKTGQFIGIMNKRFGLFKDTYEKIVEQSREGNQEELKKLKTYGLMFAILGSVYKLSGKIGGKLIEGFKSLGPEGGGEISKLTSGISKMIKTIPLVGPALGGILDLFTSILDVVVGIDDVIVKAGRDLGLNTAQATKLYETYADVSYKTGDIFITSKKMLASQVELSKALGVNNQLSEETLATSIKLKDITGLEADLIANIVENSRISGQSERDLINTIGAQVKGLQKATGISLNYKSVLSEANKLGGYLGLAFAKYPDKISKALVTTKALGTSLKEIDGLADSFLDFESSISKEFEAQLLTGKDINLQEARRLFLNNDLAGAALEINKQIGSSSEFLKMNRISAESMAAAFGMSRDQLGEMLKKQEYLSKLGAKDTDNARTQLKLGLERYKTQEALSAKLGEDVYNNLVNASTQERIAAFMDKIKTSLIDFIERSGLLEKVQKFVEYLTDPKNMKEILSKIKNFMADAVEFIGKVAYGILEALDVISFGAVPDDVIDRIKSGSENIAERIRSVGTEPVTVSETAATNQAQIGLQNYNLGKSNSGASQNQPINVNVNNNMTLEGDKLYLYTLKNIQSTPPMDNNQGQYFTPNSISFSGQPAS